MRIWRLHGEWGEYIATGGEHGNRETDSLLPDSGSVLTVADIKSVVEFLSSMLLGLECSTSILV